MRRKNFGNAIVKRSIMLAMAFMMGFTAVPSVAFADELETQPSDGTTDTTSSDSSTQVAAPSAQELLEVANKEANEAASQASPIVSIGEGVLSKETLEILSGIQASELNTAAAENRATDDIDAADKILSDAADSTAASVDKINTELDKVDEAVTAGNAAAAEAETSANAATAAKDAANAATNSADAQTQAGIATDAANKADAAATETETQASAAKEAYDKAAAEYSAAVEAANKALAEAQAKKEAGAEDAAEAVKQAQAALDEASRLQQDMKSKREAAEEELGTAERELESAQTKMDQAKQAVLDATAAELVAGAEVIVTGTALVQADALLAGAQLTYNIADNNVTAKENAIKDLEQKKADAEAELERLEAKLVELNDDVNKNQDEYDQKVAEYNALKAAVEAADAALAEANDALEVAKKDFEEKINAYNDIAGKVTAEGSYEKTVYDFEKEINNATTAEERNVAVGNLVVYVMAQSLGIDGENKWFGESDGDYYTVISKDANGTENTQYYKTEIKEDGSIEVWEYNRTGTEYVPVEGSAKTFNSQVLYDAAIAGKVEGKDYTVEHTEAKPPTEAEYTVSYVAHKAGDENEAYTSTYASKANRMDIDKLTEDTKANKELQGMYVIAQMETHEYRFEWNESENKWKATQIKKWNGSWEEVKISITLSKWSLPMIKSIHYKTVVKETVQNVTESELRQYSSKAGYESNKTKDATAAILESWKVTSLQPVNSYKLADDIVDGQQSSLYKEYNDKQQAKNDAEATFTAAQTKVNNITNGYKDEDGTVYPSLETLKSTESAAKQEMDQAETDLKNAKEEYAKANAEYNEKKAAYEKYYEGKKLIFGLELPSQYEMDMAEAKLALEEAKVERAAAKKVLDAAKVKQAAAKMAHDEAVKKFEVTSRELADALVDATKAAVELAGKEADVLEAKAKLKLAESREDYANKLEQECAEALAAARAAQEAIDNYDVSIEGKDKLDALKAELEEAEKKYQDLSAKAEEARKLADEAAKAADEAVKRVATLLAEEAARRNEAAATTTTTTSSNTTVYYATPSIDTEVLARTILEIDDTATPLAGATTGTTRRARTVAAAEGDTTTIGDEETPLAGDTEEDTVDSDSVAFIEDEETPLAGEDKDSFNWWWLLLVAIAAACGGTYYYNKKKKAQTIETK